MKILLIHTFGIGDWLFFTPVLKTFQKAHPKSTIDVILGTNATLNLALTKKERRSILMGFIPAVKIK